MTLTIASSTGDDAYPPSGRRVDPALLALDERLFNPAGWFVIDANNQAIKGIAFASLADGLELVGKGRVAAVVGRLRPGALVVDIDVPGDFGHFIAEELEGWLSARGWWSLIRPSGGAHGRAHVFAAHVQVEEREELRRYVARLAADLKLRRVDLDVRDAVRPLSSPHRHGARTRPLGNVREAQRGLKRVFADLPSSAPLARRVKVRARAAGHAARHHTKGGIDPVGPLSRPSRSPDPVWRRYLNTGAVPTAAAASGDRSLVEALLTLELVWCGEDAHSAWRRICEAHPTAMTKARHQGWSWWVRYVWNAAVTDARAYSPAPPETPRRSPDIAAAVAEARERLEEFKFSQPARARASLLLVGHHLLDRMARTGSLRVPCPERNLVLDTGITDRKTIRRALRLLDGPLGTLHRDCLSLADRSGSSFEFEIKPAASQGGLEIPPPSSHPPPPPQTWHALPRACHSIWRSLVRHREGLELAQLLQEAGCSSTRTSPPSKSELSAGRTALLALSSAGLALVDEEGVWRLTRSPARSEFSAVARERFELVRERILLERAEFRAGVSSRWSTERRIALKAERDRHTAWWESLGPEERARRRIERRAAFAALSVSEQAALKASWAELRVAAGVNEAEHHSNWLNRVDPDEFVERSLRRKASFAKLSSSERGLAVKSWQAHRARFGIPVDGQRHPAAELSLLLPHGPSTRDSQFIETQGVLFGGVPRKSRAASGSTSPGQ